MGFFSNGTEGMMWDEQWCSKCYHGVQRDNGGNYVKDDEHCCPVILAHMGYQKANKEENVLDLFITRKGAFNGICTMFLEIGVGKTFRTIPKNQLKLEMEFKENNDKNKR